MISQHDAFLVACYSQHPLVPHLKAECEKLAQDDAPDESGSSKFVTGIFEASALASLALVGPSPHEGFGIVSTGKVWETALLTAVESFLGVSASAKFVGCETTGLNASELHELPAEAVRQKMKEATKRLIEKARESNTDLRAICLGCAGMVGLEQAVREACMSTIGHKLGRSVAIVDGVKAGVGLLVNLVKAGF